MNNEIKQLVEKTKRCFPDSYILNQDELILEPENNICIKLTNIQNELDFKCKILAYLSRPSCKGLSEYWQTKILHGLNSLLETNFTKEDAALIYTWLGYDVNRELSKKFIKSNYDVSLLRRLA